MPIYDIKCDKCSLVWEELMKYGQHAPDCPTCGSSFTQTIPSTFKTKLAKDPYDYLDGYRPDSKPIKSFANDRRKGGKDTT